MNTKLISEEILKQLRQLEIEQQQQVLEFTRTLIRSRQAGVPGKSLVPFAGSIPGNDLELMQRAIDEGCEKIATDEW